LNESLVSETPQSIAEGSAQFRSQVGHISRHSGAFFAGTIFTVGLSYIFKVYLARVLGAEALGIYALGMTLVGFLGIFNSFGLSQSALRFVAAYQASGKFKELHALLWGGAGVLLIANALLAGVFLIFGKAIALHFYHAPALVKYLPWFALILLSGVLSGFYGKVLAGFRDIQIRTLIVNFIGSPLIMLLAVLLISAGMGLRGYLIAQILGAVVVGSLLIAAVWRFTPKAARLFAQSSISPERQVWSFSAAMLGVAFLEFLIGQVDKVALGFYRGPRAVGIYSVAAAFVVYVPIVLNSINQIFAPTIVDLHARGDHALLRRLFQSLTKWTVGLTMPLALVVIVFARPLMRIFGADFELGWPILIIGTLGQLVNCGVGSVGYLLLMSGHEKRLIRVQMFMALCMIVASAVLVPLWGIYGAAVAAASTNIGINLWNLLEVRKALGILPYNRSYLSLTLPISSTLALVLVLKRMSYAFRHDWLAIGVTLLLAYLIFPAVFLAISGLDADDRLIASALRSRLRGALGPWGGSI
jgi:O-antigen/teichoic acid export membrane protein